MNGNIAWYALVNNILLCLLITYSHLTNSSYVLNQAPILPILFTFEIKIIYLHNAMMMETLALS